MSVKISLFHYERALSDAVQRLEHYKDDRVAVWLHLSMLQPHRRQPHHLRIATETLEHHLRPLGGQLFPLTAGDILYLGHAGDEAAIGAAVDSQRALFAGDPLLDATHAAESSTVEDSVFCTWYRLASDYTGFLAACRDIHHRAEQSRSLLMQDETLAAAAQPGKGIDPGTLGRLEDAIAQADLGNSIRSQTACTILPGTVAGAGMQPVFREYFVSVAELGDAVVPGVLLDANRWLFQYLTLILDRRMMAHIVRVPEIRGGVQPFSLNMNVATILSPDFQAFDARIPGLTRGRLVIELQLIDIFADLGAYIFARDYLQERGYRVAIDGLTHLTLRYVDRARLGADLVKLYWTPDGLDTLSKGAAQAFRAQVMETGQARTVLCRCEDERALELGQESGIIMYQGRYIERLYNFHRNRMQPRLEAAATPGFARGAPPLTAVR